MNTITTILPKIDIHSHLIYDYDLEKSLDSIKSNSIKDIICTPNYLEFRESNYTNINEQFKILKNSFEETDTNLFLGMEFKLNNYTLSILKENNYNCKYLFVTFDDDLDENTIINLLDEVMDLGYSVVLSNSEKYNLLNKKSFVQKLKENDVIIEVKASSILHKDKDKKSNKLANKLLKKGIVDVVASSNNDYDSFVECYDYICQKYNYRLANNLFYQNPKVIVDSLKN